MMIYGSVCSGIEAASVAWESLGWQASFLSEIEPFPRSVLAHHYPDTPLHGDFTTIQDGMYEPINLLVGGTPCQSFSVAGLRKGLDDPRGNLMLEFGALARRLNPNWLVWENVPGVLSSNGGRDFGAFLGMLEQLGYGFAYRVLDATNFGLQASRKRVFVVGCLGDWRSAAAVLFERQCLQGNYETNEKRQFYPCLYASMGDKWGSNQWVRSGFGIRHAGRIRKPTPTECERLLGFPDDYTKIPYCGKQSRKQKTMELDVALRNNAGAIRNHDEGSKECLRPLLGRDGSASRGSLSSNREGERDSLPSLQHQDPDNRGHGMGDAGMGLSGGQVVADGPRYKALGNSMAVPVMKWIGERIALVNDL